MGNLGPLEIALILLIVLLLFGAKRLPELGRSLGSGMREFKDSVTGKTGLEDPNADAFGRPEIDRASAQDAGVGTVSRETDAAPQRTASAEPTVDAEPRS
jgi:sec-independent protein translocase protein TatA